MGEPALHRRVMTGRDVWTLPLRGLLRVCSGCYAAAVAWRNRRFNRGTGAYTVGVPVISVGNITTGGTGKTPLVIEIVRRLQQRGRRVAALSRGYKAAPGRAGDEIQMVAHRVPHAVCIADPNRVAAAQRVIAEQHVDVIVLDDGFQHRHLARDLDVVAIDATCPFGFGHLLPRGLLREPVASLRRAGLIVITRADQVEENELRALHARLDEIAPAVPRANCRHRVTGLVQPDGTPSSFAIGQDVGVLCFSAIGNPDAFETTVRQLGAALRGHIRYERADLIRVVSEAEHLAADVVLTTEKDAVKLANLDFDWPAPLLALRVDIDFLDDGDTILSTALDQALQGR